MNLAILTNLHNLELSDLEQNAKELHLLTSDNLKLNDSYKIDSINWFSSTGSLLYEDFIQMFNKACKEIWSRKIKVFCSTTNEYKIEIALIVHFVDYDDNDHEQTFDYAGLNAGLQILNGSPRLGGNEHRSSFKIIGTPKRFGCFKHYFIKKDKN